MTRDDSQSCLAFSEEHSCMAFQSFIACIAWNIQSEVSTTLKVIAEAFLYPYLITGLYIGTVAFTFHKTAATVGLETKPTLAATRNETGRNNYQTLPIVIRTEH